MGDDDSTIVKISHTLQLYPNDRDIRRHLADFDENGGNRSHSLARVGFPEFGRNLDNDELHELLEKSVPTIIFSRYGPPRWMQLLQNDPQNQGLQARLCKAYYRQKRDPDASCIH